MRSRPSSSMASTKCATMAICSPGSAATPCARAVFHWRFICFIAPPSCVRTTATSGSIWAVPSWRRRISLQLSSVSKPFSRRCRCTVRPTRGWDGACGGWAIAPEPPPHWDGRGPHSRIRCHSCSNSPGPRRRQATWRRPSNACSRQNSRLPTILPAGSPEGASCVLRAGPPKRCRGSTVMAGSIPRCDRMARESALPTRAGQGRRRHALARKTRNAPAGHS